MVLFGFYMAGQLRSYSDYSILSESDRTVGESEYYSEFNNNLLTYGSDGVFCVGMDNTLLWSQSFELGQILFDRCGDYAIIAEKSGMSVYLFNTGGFVSRIDVTDRILQAAVSAQGEVAVVLDEDDSYGLELYDSSGEEMASGKAHMENNGYPMSVDVSYDGTLMAVAFMNISGGKTDTRMLFYNFGSVGENEVDHVVSEFEYEDCVVAEVSFLKNGRLVAFGDNGIMIYSSDQKPELIREVELEDEVTSVFTGENGFGVVYYNKDGLKNESSDAEALSTYTLSLYSSSGKLRHEQGFDLSYNKIEILENGEVCILGDNACEIISKRGSVKFTYSFDEELCEVISAGSLHEYYLVMKGHTDKVRLK